MATFGGRRDAVVAFVVDLTERKQAEAEARETERRYREVQLELEHANRVATVGQLSASIAYEVNQPIAAAVTNTHTALRWLDAQPPNLDKGAAGARAHPRERQSGRRGDRGDPRPDQEGAADVGSLDDERSDSRGHCPDPWRSAEERGFGANTAREGLPVVEGDKVQLQQVVLDLIINAVQAMTSVDQGMRELLISTDDAFSEGVLVAVADSGPGLTPADFERLFEAFYTTKPGGLGMGLPICRSIIKANGGRLWATANVPRGAVFQFTIPA